MVFVECVPKYCPCGEACGNQCFSKREYVRMELFLAGKKDISTVIDSAAHRYILAFPPL